LFIGERRKTIEYLIIYLLGCATPIIFKLFLYKKIKEKIKTMIQKW
jgi:hypothetical protein